jgi:putative nucleotidyltransferase with HDIG domain
MSLLSRPLYRTRQFFGAFRPRIEDGERLEAQALLGARLWALFESMSKRDQRHSLDTFLVLRNQGRTDPDLLIAALLHDVGKGRLTGARVRMWHRVVYVLLGATAPSILKRMTNGRGGIANLYHHAERGAVVAEALGVGPAAVDLIRRHHEDGATDEQLIMLRAADEAC